VTFYSFNLHVNYFFESVTMVMQANIYVKNSNNFFLYAFLVKRSWKARRGGGVGRPAQVFEIRALW
jgi:hypothetical protein